MPHSTNPSRAGHWGARLLLAALVLDAAELVLCGFPLFSWVRERSWGRGFFTVGFSLVIVFWLLAILRAGSLLKPYLEFTYSSGRGEKVKLPDPDPTRAVFEKIPRETAAFHLLVWMGLTLALATSVLREGGASPLSVLAMAQWVLSSLIAVVALRSLVFEVVLAPIRPVLLPQLHGIRLFADRYLQALLFSGIATLGLGQFALTLFYAGFGSLTDRSVSVAFFGFWAAMAFAALFWWRILKRESSPMASYLATALQTKKNLPRDEPKAIAAFTAAQFVPYRLGQAAFTWLLVANVPVLLCLFFRGLVTLKTLPRFMAIGFFVSLVLAVVQFFAAQSLLRPFLQYLGSRHFLPRRKVHAPMGLHGKLLFACLGVLLLGVGATWLYLTNPHPTSLGLGALLLGYLVLGTIVVFVVRNTVAPLAALEERSGEMATGQLARPVPPWGEADETGRLALVFEEMRRSLRDRLRSTESINVDLEREVRRRTLALEERNAELHEALEKLRRAQDTLLRSEKLASMGRLVAGIAHEINNPVNAVINSLGPLKDVITQMRDESSGEKIQKSAQEAVEILAVVERGTARTKAIVQALHGYARGDDKVSREVDLTRSVEETLGLLTHRLRRVKVERQLGENVRIQGFPGQIDQVLMNLITNAAQAMGDREGTIRIVAFNSDAHVVLAIEDDGPGIPSEILPRIFDPFFTTKEVGEGSGLGLSIVHGIVDRHGGRIDVSSAPGKGTKFTLHFPLPAAGGKSPQPERIPAGK